MSGISQEIYQNYLHSKDQEEFILPTDVAEVRDYFNQVTAKFGLLDLQTKTLVSEPLVVSSHELNCKGGQQIVSVLVR